LKVNCHNITYPCTKTHTQIQNVIPDTKFHTQIQIFIPVYKTSYPSRYIF
jgi:hypothetical protein